MKKIVGIVAAASLVAGLAFAEPTANLSFSEFTGNAQVQWGVDLDSGTTGFKNTEQVKITINLFDAGERKTESDNDVWAELVLKAGNTKNWTHKLLDYDWKTTEFPGAKDFGYTGSPTEGGDVSFRIDAAKIHFNDFYVSILSGDTTVGEYKFDGAIRGYDHWKGQGKWLTDVGPKDYSQGITVGYGNSNLGIDVDFRSYGKSKNQYTSNYAVAVEAQLKDSNEWLEGLAIGAGMGVNLSSTTYDGVTAATAAKEELKWGKLPEKNATAVDPFGTGSKAEAKKEGWYVETTAAKAATGVDGEAVETKNVATTLGYMANAGYKIKIDDKYWFKPSVAMTGTYGSSKTTNPDTSTSGNATNLVVGAMFGWGSAQDAEGGVYYFDNPNNASRKVCSGVSVVANIPLATTSSTTAGGTTSKTTAYDKALAIIVPSFYTKSDLVDGLTAAAYSEIALLRGLDAADRTKGAGTNDVTTYGAAADKSDTFALALAAALKYDIKVDEITVTPQAGFRFVNTAYADNKIGSSYAPLKNEPFFTDLGAQKNGTGTRAGLLDNGYFNLKAGVNVNGLVNNTDIFAVYQSANLLNGTDYSVNKNADGTAKKFYNVKLGTFNVGAKISF